MHCSARVLDSRFNSTLEQTCGFLFHTLTVANLLVINLAAMARCGHPSHLLPLVQQRFAGELCSLQLLHVDLVPLQFRKLVTETCKHRIRTSFSVVGLAS